MTDLQDLYQEVILEHAKSPRNFHQLDNPTLQAEGDNPLCGDHCKVFLAMHGDVLDEVAFQGSGCAISRASASMMTQSLKGKTVIEAKDMLHKFVQMATGQDGEKSHAELGKLAAFAGVAGFPSRVKCATLAWHALEAALHGDREPVSTE